MTTIEASDVGSGKAPNGMRTESNSRGRWLSQLFRTLYVGSPACAMYTGVPHLPSSETPDDSPAEPVGECSLTTPTA